jgi:hypothetical protein
MWDGSLSRTGNAVFSGVGFTLGGQHDTSAASLILENNGDRSASTTIVQYSSFQYCRTFCLYANGHNNANITNNVFFEGRNFHMKLTGISNFNVVSNVMIGAIFRPNIGS